MYEKSRATHTVDYDMVLCRNLKLSVGPDGFRLFDNPTVKKGIAVMFWIFVWECFLLQKIARLLRDKSQNIWTPN